MSTDKWIIIGALVLLGIITAYCSFSYSEEYVSKDEEILASPPLSQQERLPPEPPVKESVPEPPVKEEPKPPIEGPNNTVEELPNPDSVVVFTIPSSLRYHIKTHFSEYPPVYDVTQIGDDLKIVPHEGQIYNKKYYDTIYIDGKRSVAAGDCEDPSCKNPEEGILLNYYDADVITVDEWMEKIKGAKLKEKGIYISGRETNYAENGGAQIWIDAYYNLPLKIIENSANPIYFDYQSVNNPNLNVTPLYGWPV